MRDGSYAIEPDTLVVLPVGTPFIYEIDADHWSICWFLLRDCPQFSFIQQKSAGVFASADVPLLAQTMTLLHSQSQQQAVNQAAIEIRLVEVLLYQLERALNIDHSLSKQQLRFKQLMETVSKQLQHPWTVAKLAAMMHLSEPQFYRLCQQETGMSPMKYLTAKRLDYACHLLKYTNCSQEQIASTIGYADGTTFAHRFKKHFNIAPGHWRESVSQQKQ